MRKFREFSSSSQLGSLLLVRFLFRFVRPFSFFLPPGRLSLRHSTCLNVWFVTFESDERAVEERCTFIKSAFNCSFFFLLSFSFRSMFARHDIPLLAIQLSSLRLPRGIYYSVRFLVLGWNNRVPVSSNPWKRRLNLFKTRDSSPPKAELSWGAKFISPRTHSCVPRGL